jgi:hypothetical protein
MGGAPVLSIALPYTEDAALDLRTFHECWIALAEKNLSLISELRAVLLLGHPTNPILGAAVSEVRSKLAGPRVLALTAASWGRVFNDAFLFALASDGASLWVHVDDAHLCTRPFWRSARSVLETSGGELWQLQLAQGAAAQRPWESLVRKDGYSQLLLHPEVEDCGEGEACPACDLSPFVLNLEKIRQAVEARRLPPRPFEEDVDWEELQWGWSLELARLGGQVGLLAPAAFHSSFSDLDDEEM